MIRVLHVIPALDVGGAEIALLRLIASSRGSDYMHAVVALHPDGVLRRRFQEADVELVAFDFSAAPLSQFIELLSLIRHTRPDIVQTWRYDADLYGGLAARMVGNRNVIWDLPTSEVNARGAGAEAMVRRACAMLSRWVPHTIVCAAEAARRQHIAFGYDPARMVVVDGHDPSMVATSEQRSMLRRQYGIEPQHVVVGCAGRFVADKDFRNFVQAAGLLAGRCSQARYLMAGDGLDACNAELLRWIREAGIGARITLLGERSDMPVCLAAMDVFCLSSRNEGFPNVVGEAMAMGTPCVVTDVGDAAALVGDTGVVVPRQDPPALAVALERIVTMDQRSRIELGRRAKSRIGSDFALERMRARFEGLYDHVASDSRHRSHLMRPASRVARNPGEET
jgi:glycosyltransferase involved in cell wall biosynthesis